MTRCTNVLLALAAILFAACASEPAPRGTDTGKVVPLAELPAEYRAVWAAWLESASAFELERRRVERDPALSQFVVDNLVREMVRTYDRSGFARPGGEPGRFERAQADLVWLAPTSTPVLAQLLAVPDGVVAFLAADRLVAIGVTSIPVILPMLKADRLETRRRSAELLGRLPNAGLDEIAVQEALTDRVERDSDWPVRAEAARALGHRGSRHDHKGYVAGVLLRALRDIDPSVATSAAKGLEYLGERAAIPRMVDAMEFAAGNGDVALVRAIDESLSALAGDKKRRTPAEWRAFSRQ